MIFPTRFERHVENRRAGSEEQPRAAIEPEASLMRTRCLADHLNSEAMKLPTRKTRQPRHLVDPVRAPRRIQSAPQSVSRAAIRKDCGRS